MTVTAAVFQAYLNTVCQFLPTQSQLDFSWCLSNPTPHREPLPNPNSTLCNHLSRPAKALSLVLHLLQRQHASVRTAQPGSMVYILGVAARCLGLPARMDWGAPVGPSSAAHSLEARAEVQKTREAARAMQGRSVPSLVSLPTCGRLRPTRDALTRKNSSKRQSRQLGPSLHEGEMQRGSRAWRSAAKLGVSVTNNPVELQEAALSEEPALGVPRLVGSSPALLRCFESLRRALPCRFWTPASMVRP